MKNRILATFFAVLLPLIAVELGAAFVASKVSAGVLCCILKGGPPFVIPASSIAPYHPYTCVTDRYVNASTGNDSWNGQSPTFVSGTTGPQQHLQAVSTSAGMCVHAAPGVYANTGATFYAVPIAFGGSTNSTTGYVTYISTVPGGAMITGNASNTSLVGLNSGAAYVIFDGFELNGQQVVPSSCFVADSSNGSNHHVMIINSVIHDCGGAGVSLNHSEWYTVYGNQVYNNQFTNSVRSSGISIYEPATASYTPGPGDSAYYHITVTNNISYHNIYKVPAVFHSDGNGIILDDFSLSQVSGTPYPGKTLVQSNLVFQNGGKGVQVYYSEGAGQIDVFENTAYQNNQDALNTETIRGEISVQCSSNVNVSGNIGFAIPGAGNLATNSAFGGGDDGTCATPTGVTYNGANMAFPTVVSGNFNVPAMFTAFGLNSQNGVNPNFTAAPGNLIPTNTAAALAGAANPNFPITQLGGALMGSPPDVGTYKVAGTPSPPAAEAYFMAGGVDSGGTAVGVDCTYAAPCKTLNKAFAMQVANLAAYPDFRILLVTQGSLPIPITSTVIFNSHNTPPIGHQIHLDSWPTQTWVSAETPTAGTWTGPTTLPAPNTSGAQACVSTALTSLAPLTEANAASYAGVAWVKDGSGNFIRVQEPIRPLIGAAPDVIPGTAGTSVGSNTQPGPTATFTSGNANIVISDLSKVGIVGDPIAFNTAVAPFNAVPQYYYIKSKAAATGSGNITVGTFSGGAATPTASATVVVGDSLHPNNFAQWVSSPSAINQFPVNSDYVTAVSGGQPDVGVWMPSTQGGGGGLFRTFSATSSLVTLSSHAFWNSTVYAGQRIRRWNVFEDLGTNSAVGEMYTNRTTGVIYLTPPAGVTCASLNVAGNVILPGTQEIILKISSATADGSASNVPVGRLRIGSVGFRGTNTSAMTNRHNTSGNNGGFIGGGDSFRYSSLDAAVTTIGASFVKFDGIEIAHNSGSGLSASWGSNNIDVWNYWIHDLGGHGILSGMAVNGVDSYHYVADTGSTLGTATMGPSTPSWGTGGGAVLPDLSGTHDCCIRLVNGMVSQVGQIDFTAACVSIPLMQGDLIDSNSFIDCPNGNFQENSAIQQPTANYAFGQASYGIAQSWGNSFTNNYMAYHGFEIPLAGANARVPGAYAGDSGLFYMQGAEDGLGDGTHALMPAMGNVGHDATSGCYSTTTSSGSVIARMHDVSLAYGDGNSTGGRFLGSNLFWNSTTVNGVALCGNRLTQFTGNMREFKDSNIFAGNFPNTFVISTDYNPRNDIGPFNLMPLRNQAYSLGAIGINNQHMYTVTTAGTTSNSIANVPNCTSGACPADGGVTWTFQQTISSLLPFNQTETHDITTWSGGTGAGSPNNTGLFVTFPQFQTIDKSTYFQVAQTMTNFGVGTTFGTWQGLGEDVNALNIGAPASNPNFVDQSGASGAAGFNFNTSGTGACGNGTFSPACTMGFLPYDWTTVGNSVTPYTGGQFFAAPSRDTILNSTTKVFAHYVPNWQLQQNQADPSWPSSSCMGNQLAPKSFPTTGGNSRRCPPGSQMNVAGNVSTWQVLNLVTDINDAIKQGINGFFIDWGGTGDTTPIAMLQAALLADPTGRFKVVLMPDTGYGTTLVSPTTITTLYNTNVDGTYTVYTHPATYRWQSGSRAGKPQLSVLKPQTGWTAAQWQTFLTAMDSAGTGLAWAPCFGSIGDAPTYLNGFPQGVAVLPFGAPAIPDQYYYISLVPGQMVSDGFSTGCSANAGSACAYIGSWTGQGWQINGGTYYESVNSVAYRYGWMAMNAYFPPASTTTNEVMLVTYNDFGESHAQRPSVNQYGWPVRGQYDMTGYYAQWWRTGVQPTVTDDAIFYSYKPQTYAAAHAATGGGTVTVHPTLSASPSAADNIEMMAFLKAPATLRMRIGTTIYTETCAAAGICTMGKASYTGITGPTPAIGDSTVIPSQAGTPIFEIVRSGKVVKILGGVPSVGNNPLFGGATLPGQTPTTNCNTATLCWQPDLPDATYYSDSTAHL